MHEQDHKEVRAALQRAFPPVDPELRRDLWPSMVRRLEMPRVVVPWYDWALAATLAAVFIFFPKLVLLLAYHL
jgi:hypothetical protein